MKNYLLIYTLLLTITHLLPAQTDPLFVQNGKLNLEVNTKFKSIEERYQTYFHGYPPAKENGSKLQKRGIRNIEWVHPDTITLRQSAKHTVATQEVILDYKLSPEGYLYFMEKHNRRTGHKISETTTVWENGKVIRVNTGDPSRYYMTLEYDENGKFKTNNRYTKQGDRLQLKSAYTYGKHPKDKTIIFERNNRYAGKRVTIHSSKKKGVERLYNTDDKLTEETKKKYNKHGHIAKSYKKKLKKNITDKTIYKYKYDKRGNWIEVKEYFNKLLMEVRTRTYIY